ncbi:NAD-dependent epimerase/dehydratase family protein [candidate division WWE3 bacterium]|uniref:NAD-dependent epimerase/dehydratase family protein n=2 Tax=candidate division WWE3 bacterium TaxID=2053526 RepID=A0A7X9DKB6_UNCKA|nr:NAD-dependent epimerase/dehydratase family protein [candidate division WWE3 bacterium]
MNILVTGAAGFIGSYISRALIWRGDSVIGIDNFNDYYPRNCKEFNVDLLNATANNNLLYYSKDLINPVYTALDNFAQNVYKKSENPGSFKFYEGDIVDYEFLSKVYSENKIDAVIHMAAMAGVPYSTKMPRLYTKVNVDGTVNLLNLSKDNGISKFVFASSSSVYGDREDKKVTEEDDVSKAVSVYGASKVAGEVLCHAFHVIYGLPVVIDRIFGPIYGPLQRPYGMFHQRAINYLYNKKTIQIYGKKGLETAKDSTYIDDQVKGILACLDCNYDFEVFNIGTSDPKPIKIWIDTVEKAFDEKLKLEIIDVDKADVASSADISKAKKMLNYDPHTDMYVGVKRQVDVFKMMPDWYKTMEKV